MKERYSKSKNKEIDRQTEDSSLRKGARVRTSIGVVGIGKELERWGRQEVLGGGEENE